MQISRIQNQNFGAFYKKNITISDNINLNEFENEKLDRLINYLNKDSARNICVYGYIDRPNMLGKQLGIRLQTSPLMEDFMLIKGLRPDAQRIDYKRRSHWVALDNPDLFNYLETFVKKQYSFIDYCLNEPNHISKPNIGQNVGCPYYVSRDNLDV